MVVPGPVWDTGQLPATEKENNNIKSIKNY